jgi:hypothetical protein
MAAYDNCADCKGHGYFRCAECGCKSCQASGKANCAHCNKGRVPCRTCGATGWISTKHWILTNSEICPDCRRGKTVTCGVCKGSSIANCPSCKGSGRNAQCSKCGGTQKIACRTCSGSGKVVSQWVKSLNDYPVERLRFEYEKRQREVSNLQRQTEHIERKIERLQEDWNEAYEAAPNIHNFDAGGYQSGQQAYYDEIGDASARMRELESEMGAIEQVLNSKWQ